ncbi:MAG: hypothetical protein ACRBFS_10715 [Aureispira sp.]
MKIELSHDTLAKTVYERASARDRMRLRVLNLLRVKYQLYEVDHLLLTSDEVKAVAPFEEDLDLTDDERIFLRNSKVMARKNLWIFIIGSGIATFLVVGTLLWFLRYYVANNDKLAASNDLYRKSELALEDVNKDLESKLTELRAKDSIHIVLLNRIGDNKQIIKMTNQELQEALSELRVANEALEDSKRALEKERDKLQEDKKGLTRELTEQAKIAKEVVSTRKKLSAIDQSQQLSQRAHNLLQDKNITDKKYQEAFQLARYAWTLSKNNSQAMDVLNTIGNEKLKRSNGGFLSGDRPKYTYTHGNIEQIIQKIDSRHNYGKISDAEVNRLLR